jgi:mannobiose 2-epimerase
LTRGPGLGLLERVTRRAHRSRLVPVLLAALTLAQGCRTPGCPCEAKVAPAPPPPAQVASPDAARLEAVAKRLDVLSRELFDFWRVHGPDPGHGGFHGTLDRTGRPKAPTDKGVIQQARHLYSMSLWYERRGRSPEAKRLADRQYAFLTQHFADADGEFFFTVDETGKPVATKKVLYANAFALYALATYGRVFGVKEAVERSLRCFRSLDARAHDAKHGGYDQTNDPAWLSPGAAKETNTHLHLMEAFAALYEASHDATVKARTEELLRLFGERILQPAGYAAKEFARDWSPFGTPAVSYGHDLETAWLLVDTATVLGRPEDPRVLATARRLGTLSAEAGFDAENGGYFEQGPPGAAASLRDKIWWIQAEALPALYRLYVLTGDGLYLSRLERTLDFIEVHQRDRRYGGWFWGIREDGRVTDKGEDKGGEWKASYHELRALLFTSDWIRRANGAPAPTR